MLLKKSKMGVSFLKRLIIILALMLLVLPAAYSLTASIGNAKAILRVNASPDDPAILPRTIEVFNKNDIAVRITLTPDVKFEKFIDIKDKEFILQPGESKKAAYILTIDRGGQIEGLINVAYRAAEPGARETPVGLSAKLVILSEGPIIEDLEEVVEETVEEVVEEIAVEVTPVLIAEEPVLIEEEEELEEEPTELTGQVVKDPSKPNPLVGLLIVVIIVAVGLLVFFGIARMNK